MQKIFSVALLFPSLVLTFHLLSIRWLINNILKLILWFFIKLLTDLAVVFRNFLYYWNDFDEFPSLEIKFHFFRDYFINSISFVCLAFVFVVYFSLFSSSIYYHDLFSLIPEFFSIFNFFYIVFLEALVSLNDFPWHFNCRHFVFGNYFSCRHVKVAILKLSLSWE